MKHAVRRDGNDHADKERKCVFLLRQRVDSVQGLGSAEEIQ